jgi:hypothetical protein
MTQQIGETRDAIMEDMDKHIKSVIDANKDRKNPYWIVLFATPARSTVVGKFALRQHVKAYAHKPRPQVGMVIAEVNNQTGKVTWDVNMPQKPFDFDLLKVYGAKDCDEVVVETTSIPMAYVCQ